jgi:hypothetical protein
MSARHLSILALLPSSACVLDADDWSLWEDGLGADSAPLDDTGDPVDTDGGPDDTDTDTEPWDTGPFDTAQPQPEITGLTRSFGPRGGGSAVTVQGLQFASDAQVRFGEAQATLTASAETDLQVTTPAVAEAGWVDVAVSQDGGQAVLEESFRYLDLDDATGQVGATGALQWFDYVGGYWNPGTEDYGLVQLWFPSNPDATRYRDRFAGAADSCESDRFELESIEGIDLSGATVVLDPGTGLTLQPVWNTEEGRFEMPVGSGELDAVASFDLSARGFWDLPDFEIEGIAATPPPFALSSPTLGGALPMSLRQDELDFRWNVLEADWVVFYLARLSNDGRQQLEVLTCLAENDGAFDVPSGVWSDWEAGNVIYTYAGALREAEATVPLNNGTSSVAGIAWTVGIITAR